MISRQLFDAELPGLHEPVPPRALGLSILSLAAATLAGTRWRSSLGNYETLVWLLALIPPFLLAYYKGWLGASVALAGGMTAFIGAQLVTVTATHHQITWPVVATVTTVLIVVSLGAGSLSESLLRQRAHALYLAYADPLTGLPNRRVLDLALRKFFAAAQRGRSLSVVLLDVDDLKGYNDEHGHQAGDEVLRVLAQVTDRNTRLMNVSGRYGGDELLAIFPGESIDGARLFAERVRQGVAAVNMPHGGRCTASAGIATYHSSMLRAEDLLNAADGALYAAKSAGRNRIVAAADLTPSDTEARLTHPARSLDEKSGDPPPVAAASPVAPRLRGDPPISPRQPLMRSPPSTAEQRR